MKRIGIIGGGRFGSALTESLAEAGIDTLLIDRDRDTVQNLSEIASEAVQGDATQVRVLEEAGLTDCDAVVVAIGSNVEVSTLATANCKELGIPYVVAKAATDLHGRILKRIGADMVVFPDRDSARHLARTIVSRGAVDFFELSEGFSIAEIDAPEKWHGKTLAEADVRRETGATVLCFRRSAPGDKDGSAHRDIVIPGANETILAGDKMIVFGESASIDKLTSDV